MEQLAKAYEDQAEAEIKYLYDKEELRAAEGQSVETRIKRNSLGKNEIERRAQLDTDCSRERNRMVTSEAELIRCTARLKTWEARHRTHLALH